MRGAAELVRLVAAAAIPNAAYLAVGLWLLGPLRLRAAGSERLALAFVAGSGAASLAILLLRWLDLPIPLVALAAVACAGAPRLRPAPTASADPRGSAAPGWVRAVDAASVTVAVLTFAAALGPETYWDGFEYHLPLARAWSEGPIRALPGVLDAELRAGVDLLYVPALVAGEPDAAASVSACFAAAGGERLARSGAPARGILVAVLALLFVHHAAQLGLRYGPRLGALRDPWAYAEAVFPDQVALRRMVARAPPVVAIPNGAVEWMPKPVYVLDWQRNGELLFDPVLGRWTPPDAALALLRRRDVRSLVLDVPPRRPPDGSIGHPTVDAWLREGLARVRPDPDPPRARGDRVWVQVELLDVPPPGPR